MKESTSSMEAGKKKLISLPNPLSGPRELNFELTYSCNQTCLMCDIWTRYRNNSDLKKQELTIEEIKSIVENSNVFRNLELILFSGGEPFLRPDLVLIVIFSERYPGSQQIIFTITPLNFDQLVPVFTFTRQKKIGFSDQFPIPWEGIEQMEWQADHFKKVEKDISLIMEEIYRQENVMIGLPPHWLVT